jgi:hypothetical protein
VTDRRAPHPATLTWLATALLLLLFPLRFWVSPGGRSMLTRPASPTDHAHPGLAEQWLFLDGAARSVPDGATFTVRGRDPDEEMTLHMLSLGVLRQARAVPTTYYGRRVNSGAERAQYVLSYRGAVGPGPGLELVARVGGGLVLRRTAERASD